MTRTKFSETTLQSKTENSPKEPLDCKICGDKATGRNFDVLSCESCKAFFRRNAKRDFIPKCPFKAPCVMSMKIRSNCRKCRLKKCLLEGMNVNKIESEERRIARRQRAEAKKNKVYTNAGQNFYLKEAISNPKEFKVPTISIQCAVHEDTAKKGPQIPVNRRIPCSIPPPHLENPNYAPYGLQNHLTPTNFWMQPSPMNGHYSGNPRRSPYFSTFFSTSASSPNGAMYSSPNEMLMQMIQYGHHYMPELPSDLQDLPDLSDFDGYCRGGGHGSGYTQLR